MAQTATYLIAGRPAVQGTPFTVEQLGAIQLGLIASPTNYPAWVKEQYDAQRNGRAIAPPQAPTAQNNNTAQNSGQQVRTAQNAKDDRANTQSPERTAAVQTPTGRVTNATNPATTSNAQRTQTTTTTGTNDPARPVSTTQTVPPPTAQPIQGLNFNNRTAASATWQNIPERRPTPGSTQAAYALGDDGSNPTRTFINSIASLPGSVLTPQENVLSKYASYTYNISMYMLSKEDYARMINRKVKVVPGSQLLISSGGIGPSAGAPSAASTTNPIGTTAQDKYTADLKDISSGRNQFFPLDYYFDELTIEHLLSGKGSRSPINVSKLRFKILEPYGISLLDNLDAAVKDYFGAGVKSWQTQHFLMYIKFYGYDDQGTLVAPTNRDPVGVIDKTAIVEKFIPFIFTGITFRINNKITEWSCEAMVTSNSVASGQFRGVIPYNVELTATTLKDLFNGPAVYQETFDPNGRASGSSTSPNAGSAGSAPPKASAAPKPNIVSGVVEAMNLFEQEQVEKGIFDIANVYEVTFTSPILEQAETMPPGGLDKQQTPMVQNPSNANQQLNPATQSMDPNAKTISAVAGTSLIQFLDKQIRSSSYIWDQQIWQVDPDTEQIVPNGTPAQSMAWYIIGLQADPIEYDQKRYDYAYKITYQISPMLIQNLESEWFPKSEFKGVHKRYDYWFTGQNTEVLNYEQQFNNLYAQVVNGVQPNTTETLDYRTYLKRVFQPRSNESDQGQAGKVNEPGANAADFLYSPADLERVKLSILGDPAWIFQGDIWAGVAGQKILYDGFFPDGTINVDTRQAMFEVTFNTPVDYDLDTGLMDPRTKQYGANRNLDFSKDAKYSFIFNALSCTSSFSKGKFTQEIVGVLKRFPIKQNQVVTAKLVPDVTRAVQNDPATPATLAERNARQSANAAPNSLVARRTTLQPTTPATPTTSANSSTAQSGAANGTPTSPPTPTPARNAPPTSQGQPAGTTTTTSRTNTQTGGTTVTETTETTFSAETFRKNDPAGYAAFLNFKQETYNTIYPARVAQLTAQAERNGTFGLDPAGMRGRIATSARIYADTEATLKAIDKFQLQIKASGAGGTIVTSAAPAAQQAPVTNAPPPLMNREN